ncbi:hypothetical protein D3C87_1636210 [compost metagenome]
MLADRDDLRADRGKHRTGLLDQMRTGIDLVRRLVDEALDFAGRLGRALRQFTHFLRHDCEALAGFAGARRLDGGVQRQEVGLEGDVVDHLDDLLDLA